MFESEFAWDNVNQTEPSESKAAIIDSLGVIVLSWLFPWPCLLAQAYLMKLVSLSQVSSMLMILFP